MVEGNILFANVVHKRLSPRENSFAYRVYYVSLPITADNAHHRLEGLRVNRKGLVSFFDRDHGARDGTSLFQWITGHLTDLGVLGVTHIQLIAMPRILGYVFNPVSFWVCYGDNDTVQAVLCEVSNTFGETHSYLCAHANHHPITPTETIEAAKVFHVSPFLEVKGHYRFRFRVDAQKCVIHIDYDDGTDKVLATAINGHFVPLNAQASRAAFWQHPLVTVKTIMLIHYQAVKLFVKRVGFFHKPEQRDEQITRSISKK